MNARKVKTNDWATSFQAKRGRKRAGANRGARTAKYLKLSGFFAGSPVSQENRDFLTASIWSPVSVTFRTWNN